MPMIRMALLFLLIYTGSAGCGTTGAYLRDRGDDFMDVFTVSAEYPVFGAQAAVVPAAVGFYTPVTVTSSFILPRLEDRGHGIGLRGGWVVTPLRVIALLWVCRRVFRGRIAPCRGRQEKIFHAIRAGV